MATQQQYEKKIAKTEGDGRLWTIMFRDSQTGNRAMRLTPEGGLTHLLIHAAMIRSKSRAEEIASEIREQNPDAEVTVRPF